MFFNRATLLSDRDKVIAAAIVAPCGDSLLNWLLCIKHRLDNIGRHGRGLRGVYSNMALAPTLEAVAAIRESAQFTGLTEGGRAAINSYDVEAQFLSACAASGGRTYGRSSSQAAKSQKSSHRRSTLSRPPELHALGHGLWAAALPRVRYKERAGYIVCATKYSREDDAQDHSRILSRPGLWAR